MIQIYPIYEKARMIRKAAQLAAPLLNYISTLSLPRGSLFHYMPTSNEDIGPDVTSPIYKTIKKPIQMYSPLVFTDPVGNPRKVAFEANSVIRKFLIKNRRFRKLIDLKAIPKDDKTLTVINYSLILKSYKYMKTIYSDYDRFKDMYLTLMSHVNEIANISNKHQFITLGVPKFLPAVSRLQNSSKKFDINSVKIFKDDNSRMLLELWKFLNEDPTESIFSRIEEKNYKYLNLIIGNGTEWLCINLNKLYYWTRSATDKLNENETIINKKEIKQDNITYGNLQLQKYLLRMYMILNSNKSVSSIDADKIIENKLLESKNIEDVVEVSGNIDETIENDIDVDNDEEDNLYLKDEEDMLDDESNISDDSPDNDKIIVSKLIASGNKIKNKKEKDSVINMDIIDEKVNKIIDDDLDELEKINDVIEGVSEEEPELENYDEDEPEDYEGLLKKSIEKLSAKGLLTAAEQRRYNKLTEKFKQIKDPFGSDKSLVEFIQIDEEDKKVDNKNAVTEKAVVLDKTMAYSPHEKMQKTYIEKILPKHTLKILSSIQKADIIVTDITVEERHAYQGSIQDYTVKVVPIEGVPSTFRFPLPKIESDGSYVAAGVRYSARNQRVDNPIRKIGPNKVALSSYYGKFFIFRSRKHSNNYGKWICNELITMGNSENIKNIKDIITTNVFNPSIITPRSISELSKMVSEFTVMSMDNENFTFNLELPNPENRYNPRKTEINIKKGYTPIAKSDKGNIIYFNQDKFYLIENEKVVDLGYMEDILGLDISESPIEYTELKINGSYVPIGILLAYEYGLDNLIKKLKVKVTKHPSETRVKLDKDELLIKFEDEKIVYNRRDSLTNLLLSGFHEYRQIIKEYPIGEFNKRNIYQKVFDAKFDSTRTLREFELAKKMFVDPITEEVLIHLNQPTKFLDILIYGTELLLTDDHRDALDMNEMRIRGYERIPGLIYKEITSAVRTHNARPAKARHKIDFKPNTVWTALAKDPSILVVKDINPMENLKQREEVTLIGTGGRQKESLAGLDTRTYGENDIGLISEATKDSGDVGINTYMSPNAQIENYLGMPKKGKNKDVNYTSVFSSAALATPLVDRDDAKRLGFCNIQHTHGMFTEGQEENILRTGYESVIPYRTSSLFCNVSTGDGKVTDINKYGIEVAYKNGDVKNYPLGRKYGEHEGITIPHELVTNLNIGDKVSKDDIISYHSGYFKPDTLNPKNVVWCNGTYAWFALCESSDVLEDACVVSRKLANKLKTKQTKVRVVQLKFDQSVAKIVKVGEEVGINDPLMVFQDEISTNIDAYSDTNIDILRNLASQSPRAKFSGKIEKIEVLYRGDKEDMSESILKYANQSDSELKKQKKSEGKVVVNGSIDENFRIKANPVPMDTAVFRFYITSDEPFGVGDKLVLCAQLKSICSKVTEENLTAEDGTEIMGKFSYTSISRRIINSPDITGTTTAILMKGAQLAVQAYDS